MRKNTSLWIGLGASLLLAFPDGVFAWAIIMAIVLARTVSEVYRTDASN